VRTLVPLLALASVALAQDASDMGTASWANRPLSRGGVPWVSDPDGWVRNEVDAFALAELLERGVAPPAAASREELIDRLARGLLGRAPTAGEVAAFVADESEDAYEQLVGRLFASPERGPALARRWRAWAGLGAVPSGAAASSDGSGYDDWLARALGADMPFDRFVELQLAGDLLPPAGDADLQRDNHLASAFLARRADPAGMAALVARAFLGQGADSRPLEGLFARVRTVEREVPTASERAAREAWELRVAELEAEVHARREEAEAGLAPVWRNQLADYLVAGTDAARRALFLEAEEASRGNLRVDGDEYGTPLDVLAHTQEPGLSFAEFDVSLPTGGEWWLEVRYTAAEPRPVRILLDEEEVAAAALGAATGTWRPEGLTWERIAPLALRPGRNVLRIERDGPVPHLDRLLLSPAGDPGPPGELVPEVVRRWAEYLERARRADDPLLRLWFAFADLAAEDFGAAAAALREELRTRRDAGEAVASPALADLLDAAPPPDLAALAGRYQAFATAMDRATRARQEREPDGAELTDEERAVRALLTGDGGPFALSRLAREALYTAEARAALEEASAALERARAGEPPPFSRCATVADGETAEPAPARGVPPVAEGIVPAPAFPPDASGRLELAQWIVHPEHPLTSRVLVDRVWRAHLGAPCAPALLDWLARELVRGGWSVESLERRIVLSSTCRARRGDPGAAAVHAWSRGDASR
jgi:hypothetical protein